MAILVTGGAGFIGSMLCGKLARQGQDVVVIDDLSNGRKEHLGGLGGRVTLEQIDIRDGGEVGALVKRVRPEGVVHLAAVHFIPWCNAHPREALDINVLGTQTVLEACRAVQPRMVVVASSAAVYPVSDRAHVESDAPGPLDVYGVSKLCCEELARLYAAETGRPCLAARIFNAVGPNETNPHLIPHLVAQLAEGKTEVELGNLEPCRDYIDTADLADALIGLLNLAAPGYDVFNVGTGREYSVGRVVQMCAELLGRTITVRQRGDLVRKVERMHLRASIDKLRSATGWRPKRDLADTLRGLLAGCSAGACLVS
ncbi:MAG: NAD(P)-dependent oxidoreductase [Phycisphaerae bacterium]